MDDIATHFGKFIIKAFIYHCNFKSHLSTFCTKKLGSVNTAEFQICIICNQYSKQDGPSLESSSYLNVSLRYPGPWDSGTLRPLDLGTLGPWDSWTSSLLQHLLILPLTSSYLPPTLLLWYGLVRGGVEF